MKIFIFLLPALLIGCTSYREFDPITGNQIIDFRTYGNVGFTTDKIAESNSGSGSLPFLGGSFSNDSLTEAEEGSG